MSTFRTLIPFIVVIICAGHFPFSLAAQSACPVKAGFSPGDTTIFQNTNIVFRNQSTGAVTYKWYVNNQFVMAAAELNYNFINTGAYTIKLIAGNGSCTNEMVSTVVVMQQCFQASFQKILHSADNESVAQVYNMPDESILITGTVTRAGRQDKDALMIRLDRRGKLLWAKSYGGPLDDSFKKVIFNQDAGSIMVIGETKSYGDPSGSGWVVGLDLFGEAKVSQVYSNSSSSGLVFNDMDNVGNSIAIAGTYNIGANADAFVMSVYGFDGRVFLNKRLSNSNTDEGSAICYSGDTINVASMSRSGADGDIMITGISRDGKTTYYSKRIHIPNTINRPTGFFKTDAGYVISSVSTDAFGNNARPLWLTLSGSLSVSSIVNVGHGNSAAVFSMHTLTDGNLWNGSSEGNNLVLSDYKNGTVSIHKKFAYPQPVLLQSIAVNTDSSVSVAGDITINGNNDILIDKSTLDGSNYGCAAADATVTINNVPATSDNNAWESISDFTFNTSGTPGLSTTDLAYTIETLCEAPMCKVEEVVTCSSPTFLKTYVDDYNTVGFSGLVVRDNDIVTLGGTSQGLGLTSLSFGGDVNFIKQFGNKSYYPYMNKLIQDRDKNLVFIGSDSNQNYRITKALIMKTDPAGNILWNKSYQLLRGDLSQVIECSDGNYLFVSLIDRFYYDIKNTMVVMKVNKSDGSVMWVKEYQTGRYSYGVPDIKKVGNKVLVISNSATGPYARNQSYLFVFDENSGDAIASREYSSNEITYYLYNIQTMGTGYLISGLYQDKDYRTNFYLSVLDEKFNLKRTRFLKVDNMAAVFGGVKNTDNDYVFSSLAYNLNNRTNSQQLFKIDSLLNVVWIRKNGPGIKEFMWSTSFSKLPDNTYIANGAKNYNTIYNNFSNGYFSKFTSSGALLGCSSEPVTFSYQPIETTLTNFTLDALTPPTVTTSVPVFSSANAPLLQIRSVKCNQPSACTFIKIMGPDSLCNSVDTAVFKISRNANCVAAIEWKVDTAYIKVLGYTDSTMSAKFTKTGSAKIYASVDAGCAGIIADSMEVVGLAAPAILNLGHDTTLCAGSEFTLHTAKDYKSYKWQDGSADSTFHVSKAGVYYIEVADYCGNLYRDTITVSEDASAKLTLPGIVTHCNNDTLVMHADGGFDSYLWSPENYTIGHLTKDIKIFAPTDTTFILKASKNGGCTVSDTVRVNTFKPEKFSLGGDTTSCNNEPITLKVPGSFSLVDWSTGSVENSIKVSSTGYYSVKAKDINGCFSSDTIHIAIQTTPVFSFGNDTIICENQHLVLQSSVAGNYLWQNGSIQQQQTIAAAGLYWLEVNNQGCLYRDSIKVDVRSSPKIQLGNDTTICEGTKKVLSVDPGYTNISWQDNSTASSYTVSSPGMYSIKADLYGCTASDTIHIFQKLKPTFDLGKDTFLCIGQTLLLKVKVNDASFLWSSGSVSSNYTVTSPGIYKLTATNECGSFSDQIIIEIGACNVDMPTAFTPNKDGLNDVFHLKYPGSIKSVVMQIFNRFGQVVFATTDATKGWDGTVNGMPQDTGNYIWTMSYETIDGVKGSLKGNVVLIR